MFPELDKVADQVNIEAGVLRESFDFFLTKVTNLRLFLSMFTELGDITDPKIQYYEIVHFTQCLSKLKPYAMQRINLRPLWKTQLQSDPNCDL